MREWKRAHTDKCHRQVKGKKERKKKENKSLDKREAVHLQSLFGCCTKGQLVTNLVQMVGKNILQVPHFAGCLCLTCSAAVAVLQRFRGTQFQYPKGDGKAQGPSGKLLQSSIPLGTLLQKC